MKEIKISISGESGSGKSRIMYVIKEALKSHGLNVDELNFEDHDKEIVFDHYMSQNLDEALLTISNTSRISLGEHQTRRRK